MVRVSGLPWNPYVFGAAWLGSCLCLSSFAHGQNSASLGIGLSAPAVARGGTNVSQHAAALDAVEGNPAGLGGVSMATLDVSVVGVVAGGNFRNSVNTHAKLSGLASALPYGAFATPLGRSPWVASAAVSPDILIRANWHYNDAPGTLGVTYGYQRQETQIIAVRSSLGLARGLGNKWSAGATLGLTYNQNDLHAPYIFQQQGALQGLKVLLALMTRGYGWNGSAGLQWQPTARLRGGLAWKSGTTIRTQGNASGSASALFNALGVTADPAFHYHAQVMNHLPQALDAGLSWQTRRDLTLSFQGDFTAWGQAFQKLPIALTKGTNVTINSVVGANRYEDTVPLHWRNQGSFHAGIELPASHAFTVRGGFFYATNPLPGSTLTPLTAAIMQNALAGGVGWGHHRLHYDAAYQVQFPSTRTVGMSSLQAGEYSHSSVEVWTQSVTLSARIDF